MTFLNFKNVTSLGTCFLLISANPAWSFTLSDGLTIKEAMNLTTMLEATGSFASGLPFIDDLSPEEEISETRDIITWNVGNGELAATFFNSFNTGLLMTGNATEEQTYTGLATFQNSGVRQPASIQWTGTFSESGWNSNLSGIVNNKSFTIDYQGTLNGELDEDITVIFTGSGSYDSQIVSVLQGQSEYFYDSTLDAYTSMEFNQLVQIDTNPLWLWVVGGEALVGGIIGGIVAEDGWKNRAGGVFTGALAGIGASAAIISIRNGLAGEEPPLPPQQPPIPPFPPIPPLDGDPNDPRVPLLPEEIEKVPEPNSNIGLFFLSIMSVLIFKRKLISVDHKLR